LDLAAWITFLVARLWGVPASRLTACGAISSWLLAAGNWEMRARRWKRGGELGKVAENDTEDHGP